MTNTSEHLAILRCQTWNIWPEKHGVEYQEFSIEYGASKPLPARLILVSYDKRSRAERYENEETRLGPLMWSGDVYGLHKVRNTVFKAPEDVVEVEFQHRHTQRGEIDLFINFMFSEELPSSLVEALRATTYSILALLNLKFDDYLVPTIPFQIKKISSDGKEELKSELLISVHNREVISSDTLNIGFKGIADVLVDSKYGVKLRTALELYAAHFTEPQIRVRFLLLVIALESLAKPTKKHDVALDLVASWQNELENEISRYNKNSEEFMSLEALGREIGFRSNDSLRSQIRKLFTNLIGLTDVEIKKIQRLALHVYDKRSTLVHDGELPDEELIELEVQARELLVKLFLVEIEKQPVSSRK